MIAATLYRRPRNALRRLFKPAALWLNAWRFRESEYEIARLRATRDSLGRAEARQLRNQIRLRIQRHTIGGWQ
jgi:hypothetical protein